MTAEVGTDAGEQRGRWASRWGWLVAVLVCGVLAMGRVAFNGFTTWDDLHNLTQNPFYNPPDWSMDSGILSTWDPSKPIASLYIPVTYAIWGLVAQFAYFGKAVPWGVGLHAWPFHLASLAVHLVSAAMVYLLAARLFMARGDSRRWPAFVAAAIFAAHPLQVEAVAWTSGLKDVLWVMWALLACHCYLQSAERRLFWRSRWWWGGLLCFVAGILSKPTAMMTPGLVMCLHGLGIGRNWREVLRGIWLWLPISVAAAAATAHFQPARNVATLGVPYRPLIAFDGLAWYAWKAVWPHDLIYDYGRNPASILQSAAIWWTWLIPVGLAATAYRLRRSAPLVGCGLACAVVVVLPVLGLRPFLYQFYSTVADHYIYGAMAGVGLAAAAGASVVVRSMSAWRRIAWACTRRSSRWRDAALGDDRRQLPSGGFWRDSETLYRHELTVNLDAYSAYTNLGAAMMADPRAPKQDLENSLVYFEKAVTIKPIFAPAHEDKATVLMRLNRRNEARLAVEAALDASESFPIEFRGNFSGGHLLLAGYLAREGRFDDALRHLQSARNELQRAGKGDKKAFDEIDKLEKEYQGQAATRGSSGVKGGL